MPETPPTYIEKGQEGAGPGNQEGAESGYMEQGPGGAGPETAPYGTWQYCPDSKKYYPYVKECPGGWQTVPAEPPAESGR